MFGVSHVLVAFAAPQPILKVLIIDGRKFSAKINGNSKIELILTQNQLVSLPVGTKQLKEFILNHLDEESEKFKELPHTFKIENRI